jgi:hypothetical protein
MDADLSEARRRESAYEHRGQVEGPGEAVEPRRLDQMLSLRLDPSLAAGLREIANRRGISVSELLREVVAALIEEESRHDETRAFFSRLVVTSVAATSVDYGGVPSTGGSWTTSRDDQFTHGSGQVVPV